MTLDEFRQSLSRSQTPPPGLTPLLQALWHDALGDWDRAHMLAQEIETKDGFWVHAYLHRKEGDLDNAGYWYRRASRDRFTGTLDDEWASIVTALLGHR